MVAAADCAPVYFYDPKNKAVGLCHAGWRGIAKGVSGAVIEKMASSYGSQLQDIVVAVGPYADGANYEVGESVYEEFLNARDAEGKNIFDENFLQACFRRQKNGKFLFDSGIAIRNFLIRLGLRPENIEVSEFSTIKNNDLFSSERKEGSTERDSFINIITLAPEKSAKLSDSARGEGRFGSTGR